MPHHESMRAALDDEMDFVAILPGLVVRCRGQRRQCGRRCSNVLPNQTGDQIAFEHELRAVGDVLPGTTAARSAVFCMRTEVAAAWRHPVGRCAQDLDERACQRSRARRTQANAYAFAWNGERNRQRSTRQPGDTVSADIDRFDVDVGEVSHDVLR